MSQVTQSYDEWNEWRVDDGSGSCIISDGMFNLKETGFPLLIDYPFEKIQGVINYSYGGFRLHPREISDLQSPLDANVLSVNDQIVYSSGMFELPVNLSIINQSQYVPPIIFNWIMIQWSLNMLVLILMELFRKEVIL